MKFIYESPDGGRTVYQREPGAPNRVAIKDDTEQDREDTNRWIMWRDILRAAKTNPELKEALDRARLLYELTRREV
jgi:hypothetical protein